MDELDNSFRDDPEAKSSVIFVARLSTDETKGHLNLLRLMTIRKLFKFRYTDIALARIIFVEGERVNGLERVEYYWKGN